MINKTLLYIILSFLIFGPVNAAKKVTYLKCPLKMIENKGKTFPETWWPVGGQLNEFYVQIKEGKKNKVNIHKYFTAKNFRQKQKPSDGDGLYKNLIFEKTDGKLKWSFSDSWESKKDKVKAKHSESFIFDIKSNNWFLTIYEFEEYIYTDKSSTDVHIKHKLAGDCSEVDKKSYKKLIKTGKI